MKNDNIFKFFFKNKILILKACTTNLENRCHLSMLESWKPAPSGSWQMRRTQQCFGGNSSHRFRARSCLHNARLAFLSLPFPFSCYSTQEANRRRLPIRRHFLRRPRRRRRRRGTGDLVVRLYSSFQSRSRQGSLGLLTVDLDGGAGFAVSGDGDAASLANKSPPAGCGSSRPVGAEDLLSLLLLLRRSEGCLLLPR